MAVLNSSLILSLIDKVSGPARGIQGAVNNMQKAASRNAQAISQMQGQIMGAAAAGYALYKGLSAPLGAAIEFESSMADIAKVTEFSDAGLSAYGMELRKLASSEIPMAIAELSDLSAEAAAAGIAQEDLLDFTRMTAKAAIAWGVTGGQAGEDLAKLQAALGLTIEQTQLYGDAINHLSDNMASDAPSLVDFSRRVASQGEFYGFAKEETLAFGSAMVSTGAEAQVAATSFRNMGRALTKGGSATKAQQRSWSRLGMSSTKVAKAMQEDAVGTTIAVIEALGKLPAHMQASVMGDLFGDEARALAPLLNNVDILKDSLGLVADETSYAGSVSREFAKRAETTEFALQKLKNQINEVGIVIGSALLPPLNAILDYIGPLILAFAEFADKHPAVVQAAIAIAGGLIAIKIASIGARLAFLFMKGGLLDMGIVLGRFAVGLLTLLNPFKLVTNAINLMKLAMISSGIGALVVGLALAGTWVYNNWSQVAAFFDGFGSGIAAAMEPVMPAVQPVLDFVSSLVGWFTQLTGPMETTSTEAYNLGSALGAITGQGIVDLVNTLKGLPAAAMAAAAGMLAAGTKIGTDLWTGITTQLATVGQAIADFITGTDWIAVGVSIGNAIWEGLKQIIPNMVAGMTDALKGLNPFGGGTPTTSNAPNTEFNGGPLPIPAMATGGRVVRGMTALVGEVGPEIVTFGGSGYVHPNGVIPRAPGLPSFGGRGQGIAGGTTVNIGDIHLSNPTNADPATLSRMLGDEIGRRMESSFSDGAV